MKLTMYTVKDKFKINTNDGLRYSLSDLLFDDRTFSITYLVCDTGGLFRGQKALLSTATIKDVDLVSNEINIDIDSKQLETSPGYEYKAPVSTKFENAYFERYGFTSYFLMGLEILGLRTPSAKTEMEIVAQAVKNKGVEEHLRSLKEADSYQIATKDNKKTIVSDWIIDVDRWNITDLVCLSPLGDDRLVVPCSAIESLAWIKKEISVNMDYKTLLEKKEFIPGKVINENLEITKYDYCARPIESENV